MRAKIRDSGGPMLGDVVAAACDLGDVIAPDPATASDLAVRHVERVLVHGRNARLVAALRHLDRLLRVNQVVRGARRPLAVV